MSRKNRNVRRWAVVALLGLAAAAWQGAAAATITFDFNALTDGRGNAEVQSYMKGVLAGAGFGADAVTVTGAKASKVDKGAAADGDANAFILDAGAGTIVVTFDSPVRGVSFDYELFPSPQCANGSNAHNCEPPAFSFLADRVVRFSTAPTSADAGNRPGGKAKETGTADGGTTPPRGTSGWLEFPGGVTRLEFRNASGATGIDNLQVAAVQPVALSIAEPATLVLLGIGLAGIGYARWRST